MSNHDLTVLLAGLELMRYITTGCLGKEDLMFHEVGCTWAYIEKRLRN